VFRSVGYGLTADERIDFDAAQALAREHQPTLIVCGTTAYARRIDWARFRAIADYVGAWLLADITHIAGLVAAGLHPSPIDHAHFTTTCTHKQLYGGRGGLIMIGKDWDAPAPLIGVQFRRSPCCDSRSSWRMNSRAWRLMTLLPFLNWSSSSRTVSGTATSCSSNEVMAWKSYRTTEVSRTKTFEDGDALIEGGVPPGCGS
jgi:glycine/serine hydroxymethyltransferase